MNYTSKRKISISNHFAKYYNYRRRVRTDIRVGDVVEICSLHLAVVLSVNNINGDVVTKSLFAGHEGSCDLYHCGVVRQTPKQIIQKMELFKNGGMEAIKKLWDERVRKGIY